MFLFLLGGAVLKTFTSENGSYLSIDLVQAILDGSLYVLLPVGEGERDAVAPRDDGNHLPIGTLSNERIQRNHLEDRNAANSMDSGKMTSLPVLF